MSVRKREWTNLSGERKQAWVVDYKDQVGRRRNRQFTRKKDADVFLHQALEEVRAGIHTPDSCSITVTEAAKIWLRACQHGRNGRDPVEPHSLRTYESHVRNHISPYIGEQLLSRLTTPKVNEYRDRLLQNCSRAMAKKVLASFKAILNEAQSRGLVSQNVSKPVTIISSKRNRKRVVIPSRGDVKAILETAEAWSRANDAHTARAWRRYHAFLMAAALTGMRASELRGLPKANVYLNEQIIEVRQRADEKGVIGPPKSEAGIRDIPFSSILAGVLRKWLVECPPSEFVFPNWQGNIENLGNIRNRCWGPICHRAGLTVDRAHPPFRFHDLRHFHASQLIASGANAKEIQDEMGHSSVQVTFDLYGHLFPEDHSERLQRSEEMAAELLN